jgi:GAF domain-containing protein
MVAQSHRLEISGNSMIGWCVAHKQARIALDVGEEAVHFRNPFLPETRSEIAIPLISRGEIIGALTIQSTQISAFTNEDITVLQTMADQLANAITNARLYERTQAALKDLEIAYRRYLSQGWTEYSRSRPTSGYKRSHTGIVPLGDELLPEVKRVMAEPHPLIVSQDSASAQSMLVVPVKLREQPIGAIGLKAGENIHTWSEEDIALVETLSEQLALAAENIRLLDETRRRAEREHLVSEITTKLRASNDPQTILQTVVSELRQALQAKDARILIHPTEKRSDESSQAVPEIPSPGSYDETSPANEDQ